MKKTLHMLMGAIGTGKSTFAEELSIAQKIEIFSADKVEDESESNDDNEIELDIMEIYLDTLDSGKSFILDGLNLTKSCRKLYITHAQKKGYNIACHDFGPGDKTSLDRRQNDSRGVSKERWAKIAARNKAEYQMPDSNEGFNEINIKY